MQQVTVLNFLMEMGLRFGVPDLVAYEEDKIKTDYVLNDGLLGKKRKREAIEMGSLPPNGRVEYIDAMVDERIRKKEKRNKTETKIHAVERIEEEKEPGFLFLNSEVARDTRFRNAVWAWRKNNLTQEELDILDYEDKREGWDKNTYAYGLTSLIGNTLEKKYENVNKPIEWRTDYHDDRDLLYKSERAGTLGHLEESFILDWCRTNINTPNQINNLQRNLAILNDWLRDHHAHNNVNRIVRHHIITVIRGGIQFYLNTGHTVLHNMTKEAKDLVIGSFKMHDKRLCNEYGRRSWRDIFRSWRTIWVMNGGHF